MTFFTELEKNFSWKQKIFFKVKATLNKNINAGGNTVVFSEHNIKS